MNGNVKIYFDSRVLGATNSWTVVLAGEDVNPNLKALALIAGAILVQFPVQYIYSDIIGYIKLYRNYSSGLECHRGQGVRICGVRWCWILVILQRCWP